MGEFDIFSNWKFSDREKLKHLVTVTESETNVCDLDYVTQESCVCLTVDDSSNSNSKPEIEIKSKNLITNVKVLSESSLIEVFGLHDEYLFTCVSEFIDDWEGMAVYYSKITLSGINMCKLKFTRIKEKGRLWLYSIQLAVTKAEPSSLSLNFENVLKLIHNPSHQMSEKAEKFKKIFELYAKNYTNQDLIIQSLFNVLNKECNLQYQNCKQTMEDCLGSSNFKSFSENLSLKKEITATNKTKLSVENQLLRDYIDNKFTELRDDLMKHVENKLQELKNEHNAKLDAIIKLLKDSKL